MSTARPTKPHTHNIAALFIGSVSAAFLEMACLYAGETIGHRWEVSKGEGGKTGSFNNFKNNILFQGRKPATFVAMLKDVYAGFGVAVGYKMLVRVTHWAGHKAITNRVNERYGDDLALRFGQTNAKILIDSLAGLAIGSIEAAYLPIDRYKIQKQVNSKALGTNTILQYFCQEKKNLYRGLGVTLLRNSIGSTTFFGTIAFAQSRVQKEGEKLTQGQILYISCFATLMSMIACYPADVVKTRAQSGDEKYTRTLENGQIIPKTGREIARDMLRHEGMFSFFRGFLMKLPLVPKYTISFTIAHMVAQYADKFLRSDQVCEPPRPRR